jgi:hypothetical protein
VPSDSASLPPLKLAQSRLDRGQIGRMTTWLAVFPIDATHLVTSAVLGRLLAEA